MKEGNLFCFVVMRSIELGCDCVLRIIGKLSMKRGAWDWFHGVWTCDTKVLKY